MSRNDRSYDRRTVLRGIGTVGLGIIGAGIGVGAARDDRPGVGTAGGGRSGGGAAAADRSGVVPPETARRVAGTKLAAVSTRQTLSSWQGATLGRPTTFHARNDADGPAYVPAAYVFPVRRGGEDVGYVTASARADWAPILEYSTATPPDRLVGQARSAARARGASPTGRLLYHGGVKYGLELASDHAVNLRNGRPSPVRAGFDPAGVSFDQTTVARQWDALERGETAARAAVGHDDATAQDWWDSLWDVPAWTEHDGGGAGYTLYGPGDDAWDAWDGCVPVAASMLLAYHEGYDESDDWIREWYIDELHDDMNTNDAGSTFPTDVDDGFDQFAEGTYDYDGRNIYVWNHPNFTKSEITDNARPFLLNMTSGDSADDREQNYGDHTVTVVGYSQDGEELEIHDTWDDDYHYLAWGSWLACSYTKVTKS